MGVVSDMEKPVTDYIVLPAPSGPVVKHTWGWLCGDTEAEDLDDADGWSAELPQHIADSRAIAAHIRGLEPVWLDPEPVVPRPEPDDAETKAHRVEAAKIDLMISDQLGEPHDPQMTALAESTETEVEWGYVTREAWTSCGDDEVMARSLAARFGGTVQSRTVTAWRTE